LKEARSVDIKHRSQTIDKRKKTLLCAPKASFEKGCLKSLKDRCVKLSKSNLVVVAIPAYNEEATIAKVILQAKPHASRIIVCDDGSTDMTSEIVEALDVTLLRHQRNQGKGSALRTLFYSARRIGADIVVTIDADEQHNPNEIPKLVKAMKISHADIVIGSRFMKGSHNSRGFPKYRVLGNRLLNAISDRQVTDTQSGFRAYNKKALESLTPTEMGMGVDTELLMKARDKGLRIVEVPIKVRYDVPKPSKQNFLSHAGSVLLGSIKHVSIKRPLLFYGAPGLAALVVAIAFWIWTIQIFTATREIVTNIALIAIAATTVGLMLLITSIILWVLVTVVRETSASEKGESYFVP
jgi:glycosyltransferase involved in cell wall biosynthesis